MATFDPHLPEPSADTSDPTALGRRHAAEEATRSTFTRRDPAHGKLHSPDSRRYIRFGLKAVLILLVLATVGYFVARTWLRSAAQGSLPQVEGSLSVAGLSAPVTVMRDGHGVPHIRATSMDDLILAQGYVTAQDRLWQMETLRRHAGGTLAEILGKDLVQHDLTQRTLQIRAAADRAIAAMPPDQLHWLEMYARGVNASMEDQRGHLPIEFKVLRFSPEPWTPRDSLLVALAMFQDLTNAYPVKLAREAIAAKLPPEMVADLYPVGSWRDHPAVQPLVDLTQPPADFQEIPLDESQTKLKMPADPAVASPEHVKALLEAQTAAAGFISQSCEGCAAGSNDWVVSGARTASGKPLLSNDMHLSHGVPGIWYEADLKAPINGGEFHAAGVSLPGTPFVIVGHNDHVAWGFTNLGADVQDLTIEHLRGTGDQAEFQAANGAWQPLIHLSELIRVHNGRNVAVDLKATRHGEMITPIISGLYPGEKRAISLRWTIYDPSNITSPFLGVNSAANGMALVGAFSGFGGPSQNLVYADDQGHIGYHAIGKIPLRGDMAKPSPPSGVPADSSVAAYEWSPIAPYIPYAQMPHVEDPPGGILATANARVVPDDYPYPITLDWAAPYRNERIWKVLGSKQNLKPEDMLALQTDVNSDLDRVVGQRLAYAIDHANIPAAKQRRLHQAADIMRNWNGSVDVDASAPAIVDAARAALWPLLLKPRLGDLTKLYSWGEKAYAEEQLIVHTPARWLPSSYQSWDNLLADAVNQGLQDEKAPSDLSGWRYGRVHVVDIEHPVLASSPILRQMLGMHVGTGARPQSGDTSTVKQVGKAFGPSERFTADLANLDQSTLNIVLGQSGDPASPWFMDQFQAWYTGRTFPLPYSDVAVRAAATHTLTLTPR